MWLLIVTVPKKYEVCTVININRAWASKLFWAPHCSKELHSSSVKSQRHINTSNSHLFFFLKSEQWPVTKFHQLWTNISTCTSLALQWRSQPHCVCVWLCVHVCSWGHVTCTCVRYFVWTNMSSISSYMCTLMILYMYMHNQFVHVHVHTSQYCWHDVLFKSTCIIMYV